MNRLIETKDKVAKVEHEINEKIQDTNETITGILKELKKKQQHHQEKMMTTIRDATDKLRLE